ncbi:MAG: response regulator [Acidobacteria bacterium]|nr:response regulator [Acidobacteriota bacterium]
MKMDEASLLVVDDDADLRDVIARRLRRAGFHVETAVDGKDALSMVRQSAYDLILLDLNMPGLTGLQVLSVLRETYSRRTLPIVMLTAQSDEATVLRAGVLGANDYIRKPVDFHLAVEHIRRNLEQKQ